MKKTRITRLTQKHLIQFFQNNQRPSKVEKLFLSKYLNLPLKRISIWFQNERAKRKRLLSVIKYIELEVNSEHTFHVSDSIDQQKFIKLHNNNIKLQNIHTILEPIPFNEKYSDSADFCENTRSHFVKTESENLSSNPLKNKKKQIFDKNHLQNNPIAFKLLKYETEDSSDITTEKTKRVQLFPTTNSLFIPRQKIQFDGTLSKFTDGEIISIGSSEFRMSDWTFHHF